MPTWGELLRELQEIQKTDRKPQAFDDLRRKYLALLHAHTDRNVILYATMWTTGEGVPADFISLTEEDIHGMMEVVHDLQGAKLDLILHSPGGSAEATEPIVKYLRSKFKDIRVIIPHAAMSAATMLACSADTIIMGRHSSIGPIDPQIVVNTQFGGQMVPAQTILDQFRMAQEESRDAELFPSWIPILPQYGPALLMQCRNAIELSKELVSTWLATYMFKGAGDAQEKADTIAGRLVDYKKFKSHGRHIDREQAENIGLKIDDLESDQKFQDLVLSFYHATMLTLDATQAVKIVENHLGRAYVKRAQQILITQALQPPQREPPATEPPG